MRYVWATVLGIALAGGSASADVFQNVREQGPRFKARVAKSVPHIRDADGRFVGYLQSLQNGQAWVITESRRVMMVRVDGPVGRALYFESADCSGAPLLKQGTADGGGGGFMAAAQVHDGLVYEAAGEFETAYQSILTGALNCVPRSAPSFGNLAPSRVAEVLDFTLPFQLH